MFGAIALLQSGCCDEAHLNDGLRLGTQVSQPTLRSPSPHHTPTIRSCGRVSSAPIPLTPVIGLQNNRRICAHERCALCQAAGALFYSFSVSLSSPREKRVYAMRVPPLCFVIDTELRRPFGRSSSRSDVDANLICMRLFRQHSSKQLAVTTALWQPPPVAALQVKQTPSRKPAVCSVHIRAGAGEREQNQLKATAANSK
jgi:hypothetical protein